MGRGSDVIMEAKQDYEIRQAVEALREYFSQLVDLEYEQTDIADKLPFEKMKEEIAMAIYDLESHYICFKQVNF